MLGVERGSIIFRLITFFMFFRDYVVKLLGVRRFRYLSFYSMFVFFKSGFILSFF